ncbi:MULTISPECIES: MgtC/SapB family protein [Streptococcus]|uniref:MgtC/SapB family protein n=1 Tax=Streptococcus TaxID=1301 RepID=UPI0012DFAE51|nr:MgtC/SapB family protein [Streptococcus ruminantium]
MGELGDLTLPTILIRVTLSVVLGGIIGFERGVKNQAAGIRTYILVCLASAMVMMTNQYIVLKHGSGDPTRMGAQVISGLGFLGAGTILVTDNQKIRGLTTAAGLWASAVVGLATGIGFYSGALISTVALIGIMTLFAPLKDYLNSRSKIADFHIIFNSLEGFNRLLIFLSTSDIKILDMQNGLSHSDKKKGIYQEEASQVSCYLSLKLNESFDHLKLMEDLSRIPGVIYLEELK